MKFLMHQFLCVAGAVLLSASLLMHSNVAIAYDPPEDPPHESCGDPCDNVSCKTTAVSVCSMADTSRCSKIVTCGFDCKCRPDANNPNACVCTFGIL